MILFVDTKVDVQYRNGVNHNLLDKGRLSYVRSTKKPMRDSLL